MIEVPEAQVISTQINKFIPEKSSPRSLQRRPRINSPGFRVILPVTREFLNVKTMGTSIPRGDMVEITVEDVTLLFTDGINLRYHSNAEEIPTKHQLLFGFQQCRRTI